MPLEIESSELTFDASKSIEKAEKVRDRTKNIQYLNDETDKMKRIDLIRSGVAYDEIGKLSKRLDISIIQLLRSLNIPRSTYNKKKNMEHVLDPKNSEMIIMLQDLVSYGEMVFNDEKEKFRSWLCNPNYSLGNIKPIDLIDSYTGIEEIKKALVRIEYGNFA